MCLDSSDERPEALFWGGWRRLAQRGCKSGRNVSRGDVPRRFCCGKDDLGMLLDGRLSDEVGLRPDGNRVSSCVTNACRKEQRMFGDPSREVGPKDQEAAARGDDPVAERGGVDCVHVRKGLNPPERVRGKLGLACDRRVELVQCGECGRCL